jgi:hypothetical protein
LHRIYILFKALCNITSQRYPEYGEHPFRDSVLTCGSYLDAKVGIDLETFRNGVGQVFVQPPFIQEKIFEAEDEQCNGFLDWKGFVKAMATIRAKNLSDKIDLFIAVTK